MSSGQKKEKSGGRADRQFSPLLIEKRAECWVADTLKKKEAF